MTEAIKMAKRPWVICASLPEQDAHGREESTNFVDDVVAVAVDSVA